MTLSRYLPVDFYWLKETGVAWGGFGSRGKFFRRELKSRVWQGSSGEKRCHGDGGIAWR